MSLKFIYIFPQDRNWEDREGEGRGVGLCFCKEKDLFHAPPTYKTLLVNARTPLNIYIYFQLQIVLIPGKMDLKFTEINATEMYVDNFHT